MIRSYYAAIPAAPGPMWSRIDVKRGGHLLSVRLAQVLGANAAAWIYREPTVAGAGGGPAIPPTPWTVLYTNTGAGTFRPTDHWEPDSDGYIDCIWLAGPNLASGIVTLSWTDDEAPSTREGMR